MKKPIDLLLEKKEISPAITHFKSPLKKNNLSNDLKIKLIEDHFRKILEILGLDLSSDSIKDTPQRVAKMYVNEIFSSIDPNKFPSIQLFSDIETTDKRLIFVKDIKIHSFCEHHFLPMIGKAFIAYIPNKKIIGLSKINRIVDFFSKRPQLQERLTAQIADSLSIVLNTKDVAVYTELDHLCVKIRGVEDFTSSTSAYHFKGLFNKNKDYKEDFFSLLKRSN